jgi:hypothetical protein
MRPSRILFLIGIAAICADHQAYGAAIIAQQTDGSISASNSTRADNSRSDITVGSQVFVPAISANLESLEVFTSNFSSGSRNPDTNTCYLTIYNQDTNTFIAQSDNVFNGFNCAGSLLFTFNNSKPFLQTGTHYVWNYVFGAQNNCGITFLGSGNNTVGGTFSVAPVVNAEFTAFAIIAPITALKQSNGPAVIPEGGTTNGSTVTLSATLPAALPDSLQLQIELEPSWVAFINQPNLMGAFVTSGTTGSVLTSALVNAGYHWQARSEVRTLPVVPEVTKAPIKFG